MKCPLRQTVSVTHKWRLTTEICEYGSRSLTNIVKTKFQVSINLPLETLKKAIEDFGFQFLEEKFVHCSYCYSQEAATQCDLNAHFFVCRARWWEDALKSAKRKFYSMTCIIFKHSDHFKELEKNENLPDKTKDYRMVPFHNLVDLYTLRYCKD